MPVEALLVATLTGLAVGLERQWSGHASGADARFGGLRTFTMMGLVAGVAGWWLSSGVAGAATVLLAGLIGIILVAYAASSRRDVEATTEVAGLVVVATGVLAGMGHVALASGVTAVTVLWLAEKTRLHGFAERIGSVELLAAARFAVMAAVVLPLLPDTPIGPLGPFGEIQVRQLWLLVLFFSGLSFLGYLATRAFGAGKGYAVAGALGGLVSSTSVTLTFSRLSRDDDGHDRGLASGVMGANVMLFPRVLIAAAVLSPALAGAIWPAFLAPTAIGVLLLARGVTTSSDPESPMADQNPLKVGAALQLVVIFQVVLSLVAAADAWFGEAGLYGSALVLGLTDVDALTVSMARQAAGTTTATVAASALVLGIMSNSFVKTGIALSVGRGQFRWLTGAGLVAMAAALGGWLALISFP